jgi:DNA-binding CsgD family transcriptional regulator
MAACMRGRDEELTAIAAALDAARNGRGSALVLAAGPGMGSTTMLAAVRAIAGGLLVLDAEGVPDETASPLAGLNRLLQPLAGRVASLPGWCAAALAPVFGRGSPGDPFSLGRAVHRLISDAAAERPVLGLVDDAQLMDAASVAALAFTARRLAEVPALLVLAAGPDTEERLAAVPRLPLGPLPIEACRQLLADRVPTGVPDDLAEDLLELAAGNPLALVELATALTAEQLAGGAPGPDRLAPGSRLRAALRRRFDRLSPDARRLVALAVVDEHLDTDTLVRAAAAAGLDLAAMAEATSAGLVRLDGELVELPSPLARATLHADLPLADRQAAHRLLVAVLDAAQQPLRRTLHRVAIVDGTRNELADELAEAACAARSGGDQAGSSRGYQVAAALTTEPRLRVLRLVDAATGFSLAGRTRHAMALLGQARPLAVSGGLRGLVDLRHGEIELRDGSPALAKETLLRAADELSGSDRRLAVTALVLAGEASCLAGNYEHYLAVAARAERLRRPDEPAAIQLMFDYFAGTAATYAGRHAEAVEPLRRVVREASATDDAMSMIWASDAAYILGDPVIAQELATRAVATARDQGKVALLPWAFVYLSMSALLHDRHNTALSASLEAIRVASATGQQNRVVDHLTILALGAALLGDGESTRLRLDAATRQAHCRGLGRPSALSSWAAACADLADDRPADAMDRLRSMAAGTGYLHPAIRVLAAPHFVEAAVRCGERAKAQHALEIFDRWASTTGSAPRLAQSHRCHALLAGGDAGTEEHFREAIRLHRASNTVLELAKTELFYAHQLRRSRQPRAARGHLRDAVKIFDQYGAEPWARRARAELRAAGEPVAPTGTPSTLTPQQQQIADLIAAGATNREIAAQLVVSPRTVDHHVRNILAKLNVRSRVELTALLR